MRKCVEYIHAGDIFQVVISQRLKIPIRCDPFEIYRTLRIINPSPFMFYLRTPETTLVGSSPEIMCRVMGGEVTVRPLAGTRRRGATEAEDRATGRGTAGRSQGTGRTRDAGRSGPQRRGPRRRIRLGGAVRRDDDRTLQPRDAHHVERDRPAARRHRRLRRAAGLLAGRHGLRAPKVRAMEIIDELEPHRRGPYAGAVGYFDFSGNMDTCIALRTIVIQNQIAYVQAGAGIVADSDPTAEYHETLNKARGLLQAIADHREPVARIARRSWLPHPS